MIVRFSRLGNYGRFGNQLFQYAFCRAWAEKHDARLELPPWVGDFLFPNASREDITREAVAPCGEWLPPEHFSVDIIGYCQKPHHLATYTRERAREWFSILPAVRMPRFRSWYIACHLRHGDYRDYPGFWPVIERVAFERAVEAHGYDPKDIVWVSEENPHPSTVVLPPVPPSLSFLRMGPRWPRDYDLKFLPDWQILLDAPVLFRSNSSFSWWAGELTDHEAVYSPDIDMRTGSVEEIEFVPGNHPKWWPTGPEMRL